MKKQIHDLNAFDLILKKLTPEWILPTYFKKDKKKPIWLKL